MKNLDTLKKSIFKINSSGGTGTGFALKEKNIIMTNFHVVSGSHKVGIEDTDGKKQVAHVIMVHPEKDIAILKTTEDLKLEQTVEVDAGVSLAAKDKVMALGYPFGMGFTITEGIVSNPEQQLAQRILVQTDAAINPGNSGGPLVNTDGKLVGINTAKFQGDADNVGFAVSLKEIVEEIERVSQYKGDSIAVICNSCEELVTKQTEYCPSCGGGIDKSIFEEKSLDKLSSFVETAITRLGIDPVVARSGHEWWEFHEGSSEIRIFVYNNDYLYVTSPLVNLPKKDIEPLYEHMFSEDWSPFQLGVSQGQVYISYRLMIADIYVSDEVMENAIENIKNLSLKADELDDMFVEKFSCEKTTFAKANKDA